MSLAEPGAVVGRYVVDRILGEGGMAVVYRVTHNTLRSRHALKVLRRDYGDVQERFLREGRVQAGLRHPNIVTVHDVVSVGDRPGLVMEYVEGPSLADRIDMGDLMEVEEAVELFRGIVRGMAHAHARGFVHRDLKPANVMLQQVGNITIPKIADFGIAKILTEALEEEPPMPRTRTGVGMGTPEYMAPEQVRDARSVDARADIFALGCILYEMVTGRAAFGTDDIIGVYARAASGRYDPPESLSAGLPSAVCLAIRGALAPDRDDRLPDAATLLGVLDGSLTWTPSGGAIDPVASPLPARPTRRSVPLPLSEVETRQRPRGETPTAIRPRSPERGRGIGLLAAVLSGGIVSVAGAMALGVGVWIGRPPPAEPPPTEAVHVTPPEAAPPEAPAPQAPAPVAPAPEDAAPEDARPADAPPPPPALPTPSRPAVQPAEIRAPRPASPPPAAGPPVAGLWAGSITVELRKVAGRTVEATIHDGGARLLLRGNLSADLRRLTLSEPDGTAALTAVFVQNRQGGWNLEGELRSSPQALPHPFVAVRQP